VEIYIFYTFVFIIGTLLGSFFGLAISRIPNGQNITHKRSYCPKCNHQLGFFDLIPILSYIILKGKCKYCKEKISPKYLLLEIFAGFLFLIFAIAVDININRISTFAATTLVMGSIYIATLFLIGSVDRETRNIPKGVMIFGLIVQTLYIVYLYMLEVNIYRYIMYLFIMLILMIVETIYLKKKGKSIYGIQLFILCMYIVMWVREDLAILSIIITLWMIVIEQILKEPNKEITDTKIESVPIASWICFSSITLFIIESFLRR